MAKLNGVVLTAGTIEYNGAKYTMTEETAQVGDIILAEKDGHDFRAGAYYEVVDIYGSKDIQIIDDIDDRNGVCMNYTLFRKVTEPLQFTVGDYVKVIVDTEDLAEGAIGKVTELDERSDWPIKVKLLDGSDYDWYRSEQLKKVTEGVARWAAIGREIGEFKEGDIARVMPSGLGDGGHPVGTIGLIEYCPVFCKLRLRANGRLYSHTDHMELIAPAESLANLTA